MKSPFYLLLALAAPLQAAELNPAQVPASAKWTVHLDLDAMRGSETGKAIFARVAAEHGVKLQAIKRMYSVHLLDDLHDITLYGDGQKDHAVALISGNFDQAHLEDVVKAADGYSEESRAGTVIHSWKDKGQPQNAAFASGGLLVFSRQDEALKQELDLLKSPAPAATADAIFTGKPLVAVTANLAEIQLPADASKVLRLANFLRISATENDGRFSVRMGADTKNEKQASRLRRILDGILVLAEIGNPLVGGADFQSEVTVATDKPAVNVSLSLPVAAWLEMMEEAARKKAEGHN